MVPVRLAYETPDQIAKRYGKQQDAVASAVNRGATAAFVELPEGQYEILGDEVEVMPCGMRPRHFVSRARHISHLPGVPGQQNPGESGGLALCSPAAGTGALMSCLICSVPLPPPPSCGGVPLSLESGARLASC